MKLTLSYSPKYQPVVDKILAALAKMFPKGRVKNKDTDPVHRYAYFTFRD